VEVEEIREKENSSIPFFHCLLISKVFLQSSLQQYTKERTDGKPMKSYDYSIHRTMVFATFSSQGAGVTPLSVLACSGLVAS